MNKVLIVIMFILLGTSLIVVSNMNKGVENSFTIEYQNNKNELLPDIEGKNEISDGLYRLEQNHGVTLDYNIYNGTYTLNGTTTSTAFRYNINRINVQQEMNYTLTYKYISGSYTGSATRLYLSDTLSPSILPPQVGITTNDTYNVSNISQGSYTMRLALNNENNIYNNFQFKLQLEKGSQSTSYLIPKLIPVYKDNLTQQEKNNIGIGAFGGITKIIKTISDIIKPVGDFINGLLSLF